jgi:predicted MFS family arabinose efflux permease
MASLWRTRPFPIIWTVGLFQEIAFSLMVNLPGRLYELGIEESGIGIAYSMSALAALLLRPWFGRVLDVVHRRTVLRVAGVGNIVAIAALAVIDESGLLLWGAFLLQRIVQVFLYTTALTYAADAVPVGLRTQGLALFGLSGLMPIAFANLIGDALLRLGGYPGVIAAAGASSLIAWGLVWRLPLLPVLGERPRRSFWAVAIQRDMLPLWWITLTFSMGMETVFTFIRTYIDTVGISTMGTFFVVYGGTATLTRMLGGSRYDALPHRPMVVFGVAIQGIGLALVAFANGVAMVLSGALLMGLAHGGVFPILSSEVVSRARTAERGSAVAMFTSLFDAALLIVAPLGGFLIEWAGYTRGFSTVAAILVAGAAVYAAWDRRLVASTRAEEPAAAGEVV